MNTDNFTVNVGAETCLLEIKNIDSGITMLLAAPVLEIDKTAVQLSKPGNIQVISQRGLANGGKEIILGCTIPGSNPILLNIYLQHYPQSPFIRFKYRLHTESPARLTKNKGRDNITYTGLSLEGVKKVTELQFSQFNSMTHSYNPCLDPKSPGELANGCTYPGPITIAESRTESMLLAYEHGAQIPDTYLAFGAKTEGKQLELKIVAEKGNYYADEVIDRDHPFTTPWFHMAAVKGDQEELFRHYRKFMLHYICEHPESRKPYIFYNTWNYQERNNYFDGRKYLDSMVLDRILAEIDVARQMGIDVFVIDTGWFIRSGDWLVNAERFPDGLMTVKQKLADYNMKLGLWFNPMAAATVSDMYKNNMGFQLTQQGKAVTNNLCDVEESHFMCLASGYSDLYIKKMLELREKLGVTYFKWDGICQYGCESPLHNHGNENNPVEERLQCYAYKMGMEMIRIVEEVTKQCPEIIVDFDVTEEGRFVGLGFLSVGKYFLVNNGPYAMDFDLPEKFEAKSNQVAVNLSPYTNMFFFPGAARSRFCRQGAKYDFFVPSILFLTHYLPDGPALSQRNALASIVLGGNGIWGDLLTLSGEDIKIFKEALELYREVAEAVTESYPVTKGFNGSNPEIYEKIDPEASKGVICFFTRAKGSFSYITQNTGSFTGVVGADSYEFTKDGRVRVNVTLDTDDARVVFVTRQ